MTGVCSLCGDEKPLTPDGVCEWTAGCEHRRLQATANDAAFDADYRHHFVPFECGHTGAEHVAQWAEILTMRQPAPPEGESPLQRLRRFAEQAGVDLTPEETRGLPLDGVWIDDVPRDGPASWGVWPDLYDGYGDWPEP